MKETLGTDFDGVLRKFPGFTRWYIDFYSPNDLLIRARLKWLRWKTLHLFIDGVPMIMNNEVINVVNKWKGRKVLISGRVTEKHHRKALEALLGLVEFDAIYFRQDRNEYEEKFKERIIKKEKVNVYIEDRSFVIQYLRKKLPKVEIVDIDKL